MRTFTIIALPGLVSAFTNPSSVTKFAAPKAFSSILKDANVIDTNIDKTVTKGEELLGKVDSFAGAKLFRALDHIPILFTLKGLGEAAGSTNFGLDAAASAFSNGPAAALLIPGYLYRIWPLIALCQLASVAKSVLSDEGILYQSDITTTSAANFAATKAIASGDYSWLLATAVISSYSSRNGGDLGLNLNTASLQLMSSFTTVAALLATATKVASYVPILSGKTDVVSYLALLGYYGLVKRGGNGTVKKTVNAAVLGGMLWARIAAGGLNFSDGISSVLSMSTVTLGAIASVFFFAAKEAKAALS